MFLSLIGSWIQSMAQSWLVFNLTHSAFLMGLVGFLSYLPITLFSLAAGVFVDRVAKRNLLIGTQLTFMILAFILAIFVQNKVIQVWQIIVIAFLSGLVLSFDAPARQAMVVELVGKEHLLNAIALNSAVFNSARIIGPALAGILIALIGMAGCFYVNALSYLPVVLALILIKPKPAVVQTKNNTFSQDIKETFGLIRNNPFVLFLLGVVGLVSTFGVSYTILMPIFAQEILKSGAMGLAVLMSSSGIGALAGALNLARLKQTESKIRILNVSIIIFFVSIMLFSFSHSLKLSSLMLVLTGYGGVSSTSLANTLLQINIPDGHRGRIMAVFTMMFMGFMPFGSLIFGSLAYWFGAPAVVFFCALLSLILYILVAKKFKNVFSLKASLT